MLKIPFALASTLLLLTLSACPGQAYDPCQTVDDCDPATADACATLPGSSQGICTIVCREDRDCPPGPEGEKASCREIGKAKVCSI